MLREILSISGRPGLFKLLSHTKGSIIVESLTDGRRTPVYASDRVVSLAEVAIYTTEQEKPLGEVLDLIYKHTEGKEVDLKALGTNKESLYAFFEKVLPSYDKHRVYPTDVKKVVTWYNLLVKNGFDRFVETKEEKESTGNNEQGTNE
ncbi:DUF5606 family protein [Porphyromonas circumdentaria]|uniref:Uncharacterized protein n=1 Tax=Porphyromonas circumdentaria TaxID=29524 RepID=A0A1T4KV56_9PORP|nr:DUF5606 domain-containing protein [Porphyromonas circumdentaria]MBB6275089.1 hypothetical protein [Porphyromonas circumdentaria]MDO4722972.1 DUF5606 domain-containing protein [Porphyromonas circumdentaria]SJZ46301.1 hypothetical protein SAMN02745171_00171 [Porphyromonas circumdentaria]